MPAAVCTIIAKNYLAHARVLMASLRRLHPELKRFVILVDRADGLIDPGKEDFDVIPIEALGIPGLPWFCFKYTVLELSTAVKPYALEYLLREHGLDRIVYLDPDIEFFSPADDLFAHLRSCNIVLTPHLTEPIADDARPRELDILRSGAYNLGFLGLVNSPETIRMLRWWQQKVYDHCYVDLSEGLFVDQRWVDLVPGLFSGVAIIREPGYNVAYWNIGSRKPIKKGRRYYVQDRPLVFFHYSGFDPDRPDMLSRHQDRFVPSELGNAEELLAEYRQKLLDAGYEGCKRWEYSYARFANGLLIPEVGRRVHQVAPELVEQMDDPFSDEGFDAVVEAWNRPVTRPDGTPLAPGITLLAYEIYRARADLRAAMPDIFGADHLGFLYWLKDRAKIEHGLVDPFLKPVLEALRELEVHTAAGPDNATQDTLDEFPAEVESATAEQSGAVSRGAETSTETGTEATPVQAAVCLGEEADESVEPHSGKFVLTSAVKAIYDSRPDLRRAFPDPCGSDCLRFAAWLLTYGRRELELNSDLLRSIESQWAVLLKTTHPLNRFWHGLRRTALGFGARLRYQPATRLTNGRGGLHPALAKQVTQRTESQSTSTRAASRTIQSLFGINLIGYLQAEMGVGESVRSAARAAQAAGIPVHLRKLTPTGPYREEDRTLETVSQPEPFAVNLIHANADQSEIVFSQLEPIVTSNRYNIGYWAWELEVFPDCWNSAFGFYREIWTPSSYCQQAIAREAPVPVVCIPHAVEVPAPASHGRSHFGIPAKPFVFLTAFDMLSVFERKNPLAVIEAFRRAFGPADSVHLVIKVNNADVEPNKMRLLHEAAGPNVTILAGTFSREEMNALINAADAFVSLHRAEGFGLLLAEAMYLGKPVITTGYSGNLDFTRPDNSFLVGYELRPVGPGCGPYDPEAYWADPDVDEAALHMRTVAGPGEVVLNAAARGQAYVRQNFSPVAIGKLMERRLRKVYDWIVKSAGHQVTEFKTDPCID